MFKKRRGINLSYNKQGLLYFVCVNYRDMPRDIQNRILGLCLRVAGEHFMALYTLLTDNTVDVNAVSARFHICATQLYLYRKRFYENWYKYENPEK